MATNPEDVHSSTPEDMVDTEQIEETGENEPASNDVVVNEPPILVEEPETPQNAEEYKAELESKEIPEEFVSAFMDVENSRTQENSEQPVPAGYDTEMGNALMEAGVAVPDQIELENTIAKEKDYEEEQRKIGQEVGDIVNEQTENENAEINNAVETPQNLEKKPATENIEDLQNRIAQHQEKANSLDDPAEKDRQAGMARVLQSKVDKLNRTEKALENKLGKPFATEPESVVVREVVEETTSAESLQTEAKKHEKQAGWTGDIDEQRHERDMAAAYDGEASKINTEEPVAEIPPKPKVIPEVNVTEMHEEISEEINNRPIKTPDDVLEKHDDLNKINEALEEKYKEKVDEYREQIDPEDMKPFQTAEEELGIKPEEEEKDIPVLTDVAEQKPETDGIEVKKIETKEPEEIVLEAPKKEPGAVSTEGIEAKGEIEEVVTEAKEENKDSWEGQLDKEIEETVPENTTEGASEASETIDALENLDGTKVYESFGIKPEDLAGVEGFNDLSEGQRLLVAENLKQLTLARVYNDASDQFTEKKANAGFFKRMGLGLAKNYQIAKLEKTNAAALKEGGLNMHGGVLQKLVEGAKEGPGVEVMEDGSTQIEYIPKLDKLSPTEMEAAVDFNKAANKFGEIPDAWSREDATDEQKEKYNLAKLEYDTAKKNIVEQKLEETEGNEGATMDFLHRVDQQVQMNRFMNMNPEVEEQLKKVEDQSAWTKVLTSTFAERGAYMAGGYAGRTAATAMLSAGGTIGMALAAPLTAGVIGGMRSRFRAKDSLVERDELARRGKTDESAEAKNFEDADKLIKNLNRDMKKIAEADSEEVVERRAGYDFKHLEYSKEKDVAKLLRRIKHTQERIQSGMVSYGDGAEKVSNQYELMKAVSFANVMQSEFENAEPNEKIEERLDKFLNFKKEKIDETRKKYIRKETVKGAAIGVGFAAAGSLIRVAQENDWWDGSDVGKAVNSAVGDAAEKAKDVVGDVKEAMVGGSSHYEDVAESLDLKEGAAAVATEAPQQEASTFQEVLGKAKAAVGENAETPTSIEAAEYEIQSGDSSWKALENILDKKMYTEDMTEVQRTHITDALKDKLLAIKDMSKEELQAMNFKSETGAGALEEMGYKPNAEGVVDINNVEKGDVLNLSKLFNNTELVNEAMKDTLTLSEADTASIAENLANPQGATETVVDAAASSAETSADIAEVGGGNDGGGGIEGVAGEDIQATVDTDEVVQEQSETVEQATAEVASEHIKMVKEFEKYITPKGKQIYIENYKNEYFQKNPIEGRPPAVQGTIRSLANNRAEQAWFNARSRALAAEMGLDPTSKISMQEMQGTLNGISIPEELQQKYSIKPMVSANGSGEEIFSNEATAIPDNSESEIEFHAPEEALAPFDRHKFPKVDDLHSWEEWKAGRAEELVASDRSSDQAYLIAEAEMRVERGRMMEDLGRDVTTNNIASETLVGTPSYMDQEAAQAGNTENNIPRSKIKVVNYDEVAKQPENALTPEEIEALPNEHWKANQPTPEQYVYLEKEYGREVDKEMREIFGSEKSEKDRLRIERSNSKKTARWLGGKARQTEFGKTEVGRILSRGISKGPDAETWKHGYQHEWSGNPRKGILGIKDMQMNEVQGEYFLENKDLNSIEGNNRSQLISLINRLKVRVPTIPNETVANYLQRALASGESLK